MVLEEYPSEVFFIIACGIEEYPSELFFIIACGIEEYPSEENCIETEAIKNLFESLIERSQDVAGMLKKYLCYLG